MDRPQVHGLRIERQRALKITRHRNPSHSERSKQPPLLPSQSISHRLIFGLLSVVADVRCSPLVA